MAWGGKKDKPAEGDYRGGCAVHSMHGPKRKSMKEAIKDLDGHGKRMHGSKTFYGAYIGD